MQCHQNKCSEERNRVVQKMSKKINERRTKRGLKKKRLKSKYKVNPRS